jgi:hypothetical protein
MSKLAEHYISQEIKTESIHFKVSLYLFVLSTLFLILSIDIANNQTVTPANKVKIKSFNSASFKQYEGSQVGERKSYKYAFSVNGKRYHITGYIKHSASVKVRYYTRFPRFNNFYQKKFPLIQIALFFTLILLFAVIAIKIREHRFVKQLRKEKIEKLHHEIHRVKTPGPKKYDKS